MKCSLAELFDLTDICITIGTGENVARQTLPQGGSMIGLTGSKQEQVYSDTTRHQTAGASKPSGWGSVSQYVGSLRAGFFKEHADQSSKVPLYERKAHTVPSGSDKTAKGYMDRALQVGKGTLLLGAGVFGMGVLDKHLFGYRGQTIFVPVDDIVVQHSACSGVMTAGLVTSLMTHNPGSLTAASFYCLLDSGKVLANRAEEPGGENVQVDSSEIYWYKTFDDRTNLNPNDGDGIQTQDGGYVSIKDLGDSVSGNIGILKMDKTGSLLWANIYGKSGDHGNAIIEKSDGTLLACGSSSKLATGGVLVMNLNPKNGQPLWAKVVGASEGIQSCRSLIIDNKGRIVITGNAFGHGVDGGTLFLKLDSNGTMLSAKKYGHDWSEFGVSIRSTVDGGYIVLGQSLYEKGNNMEWLLTVYKTSSEGELEWTKVLVDNGCHNCDTAAPSNIDVTKDGDYIITSSGSLSLFKLNSTGGIWAKNYIRSVSYGSYVEELDDGGLMLAGTNQYMDVFKSPRAIYAKLEKAGDVEWAQGLAGASQKVQVNEGEGYIVQNEGIANVLYVNQSGMIPGCDLIKNSSIGLNVTNIEPRWVTGSIIGIDITTKLQETDVTKALKVIANNVSARTCK